MLVDQDFGFPIGVADGHWSAGGSVFELGVSDADFVSAAQGYFRFKGERLVAFAFVPVVEVAFVEVVLRELGELPVAVYFRFVVVEDDAGKVAIEFGKAWFRGSN